MRGEIRPASVARMQLAVAIHEARLDLEQRLLEHREAMILSTRDGRAAEPRDGECAVRLAVDDVHPEARAQRLDRGAVVGLLQRDDLCLLLAQHALYRVDAPHAASFPARRSSY